MMAEHLDYVSAMVYPSHWAPGEYGVRNPNAQPYDIVLRSLQDFQKDVRGTGARVVPWLQDFSLGVDYGPGAGAARRSRRRTTPASTSSCSGTRRSPTRRPRSRPTRRRSSSRSEGEGDVVTGTGKPDELGVVPVLMHHQLRLHGSAYDLTPSQFLGELTRLWRDGFYPVTAESIRQRTHGRPEGQVAGRDDVRRRDQQPGRLPAGRLARPEFRRSGSWRTSRKAHPDFPAVGDLLHPAQRLRGERQHARQDAALARRARLRARQPHARPHPVQHGRRDRGAAPARARQPRALRPDPRLHGAHDGAAARRAPHPRSLATHGEWHGQYYRFNGVFLDGAEPSPSPFAKKFTPGAIPRIRPNPYWDGSARLHRRDVVRHPRAEPGHALRLRRRPGEDHVPEGEGGASSRRSTARCANPY